MPMTTMKPTRAMHVTSPSVSTRESLQVTVAPYAEVVGGGPTAITAAGNRIATKQTPFGTAEPTCRPVALSP